MIKQSVIEPVLPGSLEGGSCTVPTGLFPLGRLSAKEKTIYKLIL